VSRIYQRLARVGRVASKRAAVVAAVGVAGLVAAAPAIAAPPVVTTGGFQSFGGAHSGSGSLCLDVMYGNGSPGTSLDSGSCNGTAAQNFTLVSALSGNGQQLHAGVGSNQCVSLPHGPGNGAAVELEPCNPLSNSQSWVYGNGLLEYAPNPSYCLDVQYGSMNPATPVDVALCNHTSAQLWWPVGYTTKIVSEVSVPAPGLCLDDYADLDTYGGRLDNATCNGTSAQVWRLYEPGDIANVNGEVLQSTTPASSGLGSVGLYPYSGSTSLNSWSMAYAPVLGVVFVSNYLRSGSIHECLDVQGGSSASNTTVDLYTCNQTPAQSWQIVLTG
jgi:hypothetical protein